VRAWKCGMNDLRNMVACLVHGLDGPRRLWDRSSLVRLSSGPLIVPRRAKLGQGPSSTPMQPTEIEPPPSHPTLRHRHAAPPPPAPDPTEFECNICFEAASEPVVTVCGHLYCWGCLAEWMERASICPVCKAGVKTETVRPPPCETPPHHPVPTAFRPARPGLTSALGDSGLCARE